MDIQELRGKSVEDLNKELLRLLEAGFKLRMQKATGQLGQTHLLRAQRRYDEADVVKAAVVAMGVLLEPWKTET